MATTKKLKPEENTGIFMARLCGTIAGTCDHLARMQAEMLDIAGRCDSAVALGENLKTFLPKDKKTLEELKAFCVKHYDEFLPLRQTLEEISRRSR